MVILLVIPSAGSFAGMIKYKEYIWDSSVNYVTNGSLDWLRWDQSLNLSIHQIETDPNFSSWRVASNDDIATLLNDFFNFFEWYSNESISQEYKGKFSEDDTPFVNFLDLFGHSWDSFDGCYLCVQLDHWRSTSIFFGNDLNNDQYYNFLTIRDKSAIYNYVTGQRYFNGSFISVSADDYYFTRTHPNAAIALVRNTQTVPEPNSLLLFILTVFFGVYYSRSLN